MDVCRAAEVTETQLSAMKSNESTYLSNDDINVVANSRKKPSGMSRVGRAGMPLPNANTVVANTTEGEIIAERQANYVQSVGK